MARPLKTGEDFKDLHFPKAGIDLSMGFSKQPNRPVGQNGEYARTTPTGLNVRSFEPATNRMRGGSRTGLSKYIATQVSGIVFIVQDLNLVVGTGYVNPGGVTQTSNSGRVVTLVAVSQGNVFVTTPGGTSWTQAVNGTPVTPPLNFSGVIFSAANNQKLYFADGINYAFYDPSTNTVFPWVATTGILPRDSAGNTPRLIATWRGRTVVSGLILDPQNWFMSRISNPNDWNYSPQSVDPAQAIAGNNSSLGFIGDVVTTLIPYNDDTLIFGGDHTIWLMNGDPMAGGQIDLVSDIIGMAWGIPWCKDPYGNIYFVSNRTGIYSLVPGQQPQRISQPIEQLLVTIDTGANSIRLVWDDRFQGLHVFVSPLAAPAVTTHFFWEQRTGAWWQDQFGSTNHDPIATVTLDGNTPGDRVPLIGSWDGFVRSIDPAATTDDGIAIASKVVIGPILTRDMDELLIKDVQALLGTSSGNVTWSVFVGTTAEAALTSAAVASGTWSGGRNLLSFVRRSGHAIYLQISSSNPWSMEAVRARIAGLGKVRRRSY
jgi:hypothetical protein